MVHSTSGVAVERKTRKPKKLLLGEFVFEHRRRRKEYCKHAMLQALVNVTISFILRLSWAEAGKD